MAAHRSGGRPPMDTKRFYALLTWSIFVGFMIMGTVLAITGKGN